MEEAKLNLEQTGAQRSNFMKRKPNFNYTYLYL